jgi:putative alpha-1,2-mannosidase
MTIALPNGKLFTINAKNSSAENKYIQSATLNGKPLSKPWFNHTDLVNGGILNFVMGSTPNKNWGAAPQDAPPSAMDYRLDN